MTIEAIYENGVFRPLGAVSLPEQSRVMIDVVPAPVNREDRPLLRLAEMLSQLPDDPNTPTDLAAQLDHYLYGLPKRP